MLTDLSCARRFYRATRCCHPGSRVHQPHSVATWPVWLQTEPVEVTVRRAKRVDAVVVKAVAEASYMLEPRSETEFHRHAAWLCRA